MCCSDVATWTHINRWEWRYDINYITICNMLPLFNAYIIFLLEQTEIVAGW